MQPTPHHGGPDAGAEGRLFARIQNRSSVDYALRTVQESLVHFSALADAKANILIASIAACGVLVVSRMLLESGGAAQPRF